MGETLEELIEQGGERLPKKKRLTLPHITEEFLSLALEPPENFNDLSREKRALIERETVGFYKAQEKLREFIALGGTDAIADLADVRDDRQIRPTMVGNMRVWIS